MKPAAMAPTCLDHAYPLIQRGRTLIAAEVCSLVEHRRRLSDPDGYRPRDCPFCGHGRLHVHDYRTRVLRADLELPMMRIVRYRCVACRGTFRVLPVFLARHLWRSYSTLEQETIAEHPSKNRPVVPYRTAHRWRSRLACQLGDIYGALVGDKEVAVLGLSKDMRRMELVVANAERKALTGASRLYELAALVHQMVPGLRLL